MKYYIAVDKNDVLTEISMQSIESQNEKDESQKHKHWLISQTQKRKKTTYPRV